VSEDIVADGMRKWVEWRGGGDKFSKINVCKAMQIVIQLFKNLNAMRIKA
jgi:hypothetical protein